jgi:hypothetical protein
MGMTVEQFLGCKASEIEAMSNESILEYFKDIIHVVRPSKEVEVVAKKPSSSKASKEYSAKQKREEALRKYNAMFPEDKIEL